MTIVFIVVNPHSNSVTISVASISMSEFKKRKVDIRDYFSPSFSPSLSNIASSSSHYSHVNSSVTLQSQLEISSTDTVIECASSSISPIPSLECSSQVKDITDIDNILTPTAHTSITQITRLKKIELPVAPLQPVASSLPKCSRMKGEKIVTQAFQDKWYQHYPWLHYSVEKKAFLCFFCTKTHNADAMHLAKYAEETFIQTACADWKRGCQKFQNHHESKAHRHAINMYAQSKAVPIQ